MVKWEYRCLCEENFITKAKQGDVIHANYFEDALNLIGHGGWELVGKMDSLMVFKRPVKNKKNKIMATGATTSGINTETTSKGPVPIPVPIHTDFQYDEAVKKCFDIFMTKAAEYGTSWTVLRTISIVDQIWIKARRIRTIQETKSQKVAGTIQDEFRGIVNYGIIGLIGLPGINIVDLAHLTALYGKYIRQAKELMEAKNHDYGEAWREMSQESFVDLVLMKLSRMKTLARLESADIKSEGLDANLYDIINYSVFALILDGSEKKS